MTSRPGKRELIVSRTWIQVAALVILVGFFVLVLLAYRTYQSDPPIPDKVVDPGGRVLFTGDDIRAGQKVFLHHGLMEYGSIFGHGAYLGAGLHRRLPAPLLGDRPRASSAAAGSDSAQQETIDQFQTNRYDSDTKTLPFSAQQASAFGQLQQHYSDFLDSDTTRYGLLPNPVKGPTEIHQLTAFFAWSAWAASVRRPGHNYSYTNNWPPEPLVGNTPTRRRDPLERALADRAARRHRTCCSRSSAAGAARLARDASRRRSRSVRRSDVPLTPAQRATAWFFLVVAGLFLLQRLLGGATPTTTPSRRASSASTSPTCFPTT